MTIEQIMAMLANPATTKRELAQAFQVDFDGTRPFAPRLLPSPKAVDLSPGEFASRSDALMGIANSWMRMRRRERFERRLAEGYDGPVIVSEGDSWFQHPLLTDTIDVLSDRFAIRSLDAAGDTLLNMVNEAEYIDALRSTGASLLLLSAGGNDALGGGALADHLRAFDPSLTPAQHLLPSYRTMMDGALVLYDKMFREVERLNQAAAKPVQVICHGYDYALPNDGRWLGKPMASRGIADPRVQAKIVEAMVDGFNMRLQGLAAHFGNVHYLDVRTVVGPDPARWNDELHPTEPGYADVANRFATLIDALAQPASRSMETADARGGKRGKKKAAVVPAARGRIGWSLHVGVNKVDPAHYGNDGALAACEFDAEDMHAIAEQCGYADRRMLLSADATRAAFLRGIADAAKELRAGDIFFISYSGHGSRLPDFSGDEADGMDETLCLYDGMLIDDELYDQWAKFREGVRVVMLSDSCHSGTVTRDLADPGLPLPPGKARRFDPATAARTIRQHRAQYEAISRAVQRAGSGTLGRAMTQPLQCCVLLFSGCQDNQLSMDGMINGRFSEELLRVWDHGRFTGSYAAMHRQIVNGMPSTQTPNMTVEGRPDPVFLHQKPFVV